MAAERRMGGMTRLSCNTRINTLRYNNNIHIFRRRRPLQYCKTHICGENARKTYLAAPGVIENSIIVT